MYTEEDGYGVVPGWYTHCQCRYWHHIFMCHKYHVKCTTKQYNLDRSRDKQDSLENEWVRAPHSGECWFFFSRLVLVQLSDTTLIGCERGRG